jgi:hypothetical protein
MELRTDKTYAEILDYLINKAFVNVNARNKDGLTLLHEAARIGSEYIIKSLLRRGANLLARDMEGMTAWDAASDWSRIAIHYFARDFCPSVKVFYVGLTPHTLYSSLCRSTQELFIKDREFPTPDGSYNFEQYLPGFAWYIATSNNVSLSKMRPEKNMLMNSRTRSSPCVKPSSR